MDTSAITTENTAPAAAGTAERHLARLARELDLRPGQVAATAALLDEGATVPFIARYRKEATGTLDEVAVAAIRDRLERLRELDKRREAILASLEERGLLDDELRAKIDGAETLGVLEDIYLPYRPKRRTRATIAREKGLEPLADLVFAQGAGDPAARGRGLRRRGEGRRDGRRGARRRARHPRRARQRGPGGPGPDARPLRPQRRAALAGGDRQGGGGRQVPRLLRLAGAGRQRAVAPHAGDAARREGGLPDAAGRRPRGGGARACSAASS